MARRHIMESTFRLNLLNPQHAKINEVIKGLNPKIYKSKNQFLIGDERSVEQIVPVQQDYDRQQYQQQNGHDATHRIISCTDKTFAVAVVEIGNGGSQLVTKTGAESEIKVVSPIHYRCNGNVEAISL